MEKQVVFLLFVPLILSATELSLFFVLTAKILKQYTIFAVNLTYSNTLVNVYSNIDYIHDFVINAMGVNEFR